MSTNGLDKWKAVRKSLNMFLAGGSVVGAAVSFWFWGFSGLLAHLGMLLCLALGFWLSEMLIGVFTAVKKANASAVALLFLGKLTWWAALFFGLRYLPVGAEGSVGLAVGIFLLALFFASIRHYGMPRISDANDGRDP